MTERNQIRAVIFDVGGVLDQPADTAAELIAHQQLAAQVGLELDDLWAALYQSDYWKLARTGQISDAEFWCRCLSPLGIKEPIDQRRFARRTTAFKSVAPAMRALLDDLDGRTRLAIISNASDTLEATLEEQLGVSHLFQMVVNSARVGVAKARGGDL